MKIFNFDRITGFFLPNPGKQDGSTTAEPSPMEPGRFLVPAFSTTDPVPEVPAGMVARRDREAGRWVLVSQAQAIAETSPPEPELPEKIVLWRGVERAFENTVAVAFGFDSMDDAVSFASEPEVPRLQILGIALRAWRSKVRAAFEQLVAEVRAGVANEPASPEDLRRRLPAFEQPDTTPDALDAWVKAQGGA
jgi:hypothetical protein